MTSIPLSLVVSFLRPRGALGVLEGAPYTSADVYGLAGLTVDAIDGEVEQRPDAALYLGDAEICPAAEGWAVRLLALSHHEQATHIDFSSLSTAELLRGNRLLARWIWHDYPPRTLTFREVPLVGPPPSTPAERLAAVLTYELERAR